jgi:chromosome segregation ATPase
MRCSSKLGPFEPRRLSEEQEPKQPPGRIGSALASAGTVGTRVSDFVSRLATLTKEQERHSRQLEQITEQLFALAKDVQRMAGRAEGIEKRLDDKDKMVEAIIALKVLEAIEKLRSELK